MQITLFELEGMIIDLASKYHRTINPNKYVNHDYEDFVAEARLAAYIAITKWKSDKGTKVSTYVYKCVENKFKDMHRFANRNKRPTLYFYDDSLIENFSSENFHYDDYDRMNREISVRRILNGEEYELYSRIMNGYRMCEIADLECEKNKLNYNRNRGEIKKCFTRILQKLKSHGMSLTA